MSEHVSQPLATVRLFADDLRPNDISRMLEVEADSHASKGQAFVSGYRRDAPYQARGDRKPVIAKTGTWFLTTKGRGLGIDPERHLAWVLQILSSKVDRIKQAIPGVKIDFSLLVRMGNPLSESLSETVASALKIGGLEVDLPDIDQDIFLPKDSDPNPVLKEHLGAR